MPRGLKQVFRNAGVRHGVRREDPLVREIVYREQRGRPRKRPREVRPVPQVQRQQRGLPVVGVDHVGTLAEGLEGGENGAAEERVPPGVVPVVAFGGAVEMGAVEGLVLAHEQDADPRGGLVAQNLDADIVAGEGQVQRRVRPRQVREARPRLAVVRDEEQDAVAETSQMNGQHAGDIGQSAALGVGQGLGGGHGDREGRGFFHETPFSLSRARKSASERRGTPSFSACSAFDPGSDPTTT